MYVGGGGGGGAGGGAGGGGGHVPLAVGSVHMEIVPIAATGVPNALFSQQRPFCAGVRTQILHCCVCAGAGERVCFRLGFNQFMQSHSR